MPSNFGNFTLSCRLRTALRPRCSLEMANMINVEAKLNNMNNTSFNCQFGKAQTSNRFGKGGALILLTRVVDIEEKFAYAKSTNGRLK